jgi:4-amino-4-deoxy-L-arabinose transferase-like glycosyltransferase
MHIAPILAILIPSLILAYALSKTSYLDRNPIYLLLISFFLAAIFWKVPEVIIDASRYFTQAKHLNQYGMSYFVDQWGKDIMAWTDLPAVPFLYGLVYKFFGEYRFVIQVFTALLFSMTVGLTYLIGKSLWNEDTGISAGMLMLGIPYLYTQVPLMLVDVPTMFFFTLAVFAMIKALDQGTLKWMGISVMGLFFAFFSKYSNWLWLSVLMPILVVFFKADPKKTVTRAGIIAVLSLFLVLAAILIWFDVFSDQIRFLISYQRPGLRRWGESFISTFFFQIHPFISIAALVSVFVALRTKDLKYSIISFVVFLVIVLQIKRIRYLIPIFPMIALMAAYGLQIFRNQETKKFIVYGIVISAVVLAHFAYVPFLQTISTVNLKRAGVFINALDVDHIKIFTLPQKKSVVNPAIAVPLLDIFTNKKILYEPDLDSPPNWNRIKKKSSLRFTWEYKNPPYYINDTKDLKKVGAVVVISSDPKQRIPGHIEQRIKKYNSSKEFKTLSNLFRYRTVVTVYYD